MGALARRTAVAAGFLVICCSGCFGAAGPQVGPEPSVTVSTAGPAPGQPLPLTPETAPTGVVPPPSRGPAAPRTSPGGPGRGVPDTTAGPFRLTAIRVVTTPTGVALQVNATNATTGFLNAIPLTWKLLDAKNAVLGSGTLRVSLAPGETTTLHQEGPGGAWTRITFAAG